MIESELAQLVIQGFPTVRLVPKPSYCPVFCLFVCLFFVVVVVVFFAVKLHSGKVTNKAKSLQLKAVSTTQSNK